MLNNKETREGKLLDFKLTPALSPYRIFTYVNRKKYTGVFSWAYSLRVAGSIEQGQGQGQIFP